MFAKNNVSYANDGNVNASSSESIPNDRHSLGGQYWTLGCTNWGSVAWLDHTVWTHRATKTAKICINNMPYLSIYIYACLPMSILSISIHMAFTFLMKTFVIRPYRLNSSCKKKPPKFASASIHMAFIFLMKTFYD